MFLKASKFFLINIILFLIYFPSYSQDFDFKIKDYISKKWTNEFVSFPLTPKQLENAKKGYLLLEESNIEKPYQLFVQNEQPQLGFMVNLNPFETKYFKFCNQVQQ